MNPKARSAANAQAVLEELGVEEPVQAPEPQAVTDNPFADLLTEAPARPLNPFARARERRMHPVPSMHGVEELEMFLSVQLRMLAKEWPLQLHKVEQFARLSREMLAVLGK